MQLGPPAKVPKTARQLYRECLRAIRHTAARSEKAQAMRQLVKNEFYGNREVYDPQKLEKLRKKFVLRD